MRVIYGEKETDWDSGSAGGAGSWAVLGKAPGRAPPGWRNEQMDMQRTARETLKAFCRAWYEQRNVELAAALSVRDVEIVNPGGFGLVHGVEGMTRRIGEAVRNIQEPFVCIFSEFCEQTLAEGVCSLTVELTLYNSRAVIHRSVFAVLALDGGEWRVKSLIVARSGKDGGQKEREAGLSWLERELAEANEELQDIINAIPGGVAIYKVSDRFETVYFSDGVPELSGYTPEEYRELAKGDAANMTYWEDTAEVVTRALEVIRTKGLDTMEFRKQHRDGHIVWVRAQVKWIGEEDGFPLLHCVFHNITDLKEARQEMEHLVNSIPGGIASYQIEDGRFVLLYFSDGVMKLSGHTREEYGRLAGRDAMNLVCEHDRDRVSAAARAALASGEVLDVSYRMRHKDGRLIWIHLNGRRIGPLADRAKFYAVFTGLSAENRLFQSLSGDLADGIYVIEKENYDLLYVNESKRLFAEGREGVGQKCYQALYGKDEPCEYCSLRTREPDGQEHEMIVPETGRFYSTSFRETDWNGIPAYVKIVRDVTGAVELRREKERLAQYFETVLKNLPGGVAVVRRDAQGKMEPEFMSEGFAAMTEMTMDQAWELYRRDAMEGVHPEDRGYVNRQMAEYIAGDENHCEIVYRLRKGGGGYVWVKNTLSLIQSEAGEARVYSVYRDMTREREEQSRLRQQYKDLIMQHYQTQGPDALVLGHCNITQNQILEIIDYTDSNLLGTFGSVREDFFTGLGSLVVDEEERRKFLDIYLNKPALEAFQRGDVERRLECFMCPPKEETGRYVLVNMSLVATPDSGDVTGILTVTDITRRTIEDRIMKQISAKGYDFISDVDLRQDRYYLLSGDELDSGIRDGGGVYSRRVEDVLLHEVVPRDRARMRQALDPAYILKRLERESSYTLAFSMVDLNGGIRTKNITISAVDLRLSRVCVARADITESVREQQGMLHVIAYTFELAGFINISQRSLTLYTRETVLENLPPYFVEQYSDAVGRFVDHHASEANQKEAHRQFRIEIMRKKLEEKPGGYDFLFSCSEDGQERFKQVNVMWGDVNHGTICLVRADVTDMLAAERRTKRELENALARAEDANRAKSDFLSTMSHDIRTPMNAIMGMTALAMAHLGDQERVADCLQKISISSRHLLSLINDILDMSKIESSQITLNRMRISIHEMLGQLSAIMSSQARAAGLEFRIQAGEIAHPCFYGDALRINQILINILSNAVKYTPEGGRVDFEAEEIPAADGRCARYRFTVRDTGVGMTEEFLKHVFEPFTRSRQTTRVEGTGLGLSITKGLVNLMGGAISVESRLHQGTVFQVELEGEIAEPGGEGGAEREGGPDGRQYADEVNRRTFGGRLFLVAEDNEINAEILCELLSMYGAKTVVRQDGAQAVRAFAEAAPGTYDAILMDVQMPEMNGYEATRAIRSMERPDAGVIPIIAMTANAFAEDVKAAMEAGMTAHVAKPIDVEILRGSLRNVLNGSGKGRD